MKHYLVKVFSLLLIVSCSSSSEVSINTNPGDAEVYIVGERGELKSLGKAPLKVTDSQFFGTSDAVKVRVERENFKDKELFISRSNRMKSMDLSIVLEEKSTVESLSTKNLNELAAKIAEGQSFIHAKNYDRAKALFLDLAAQFPHLATVHDLLGNSYFLMGDTVQALQEYQKAQKLEPNSYKRKLIIEKLEGKGSL